MKAVHKIFLIVIVGAMVGGGIFYFSQNKSQDKKETSSSTHAKHEHKKELYFCPMHPNITSDSPGL